MGNEKFWIIFRRCPKEIVEYFEAPNYLGWRGEIQRGRRDYFRHIEKAEYGLLIVDEDPVVDKVRIVRNSVYLSKFLFLIYKGCGYVCVGGTYVIRKRY